MASSSPISPAVPSGLPAAIEALPSSPAIPVLNNYINGEFVAPKAGRYIVNTSPATGQPVAYIARSDASDVNEAVQAAKSSFADHKKWRALPAEERARFLDKIADSIERQLDRFADLESRDTGKPLSLARNLDIPRAVANFRFFAGAVRHDSTGCHQMNNAINYTLRQPVGVAGLITPWNLPLYLLSWKVAPALAMGNTIVAKPSEITPMTAAALAEVIHEVGVPAGVFNLVHGYGFEAGQSIIAHRDVRLVSFTGGTATGERVAATAAPRFAKLSLELGGKNPTIVCNDCDLEATLEGVRRSSFLNQGQICLCGSRILVQRGIYDEFVRRLVEKVKQMKVGDPSDASVNMGSLVSHAHRDKVESYIRLAIEEGGKVECGGSRPEGLSAPFDQGAFLMPTVITGLPIDCRTATEEIFGPVVTVHPFDSDDEAVAMANCVRYGLASSVWTTNLKRAHDLAARIETGMVWVNTWLMRDLRVPFGGVKDSGVGREGGHLSLEFFSEDKNICIYLG